MMARRASKWEFETLKRVAHLVAEIIEDQQHLQQLADAAGEQSALDAFSTNAKELLRKLTDTLPIPQRKQLLRHVSDMKVAFTSPVAVSRDEAYVYVPRETILQLVKSAAMDKCVLCLAGSEEYRDCTFRKAVNDLRICVANERVSYSYHLIGC